jgi:hypothetical protein
MLTERELAEDRELLRRLDAGDPTVLEGAIVMTVPEARAEIAKLKARIRARRPG